MTKVDFRKVDLNHRCTDCGAPLKVNLLAKNPTATRCWACNKLRSNDINLNRTPLLERQRKNRVTFNLNS